MEERDRRFEALVSERLARAMKVKRARAGWTQADLAAASGVNEDTIKRAEAEMNIPRFPVICKIADGFGCPVDDFWSGADARGVA